MPLSALLLTGLWTLFVIMISNPPLYLISDGFIATERRPDTLDRARLAV